MPVLVAGLDLETLGVTVRRWDGDVAPAIAPPAGVAVPGRAGLRPNGAPPAIGPRTFTIDGKVDAANVLLLEQRLRALFVHCGGGGHGLASAPVALAFPPPGQPAVIRWTAYLSDATTVERRNPVGVTPTADVRLAFVALDPFGEDVSALTLLLDTTPRAPLLGDVVSYPVLELPGPWTTRECVLTRAGGPVVGTLALAGAVATGERVEVNSEAQTITHVAANGTRTPRAAWLVSGDFPRFDPAHAVGGVPATIALLAGAGTITYRRRWR